MSPGRPGDPSGMEVFAQYEYGGETTGRLAIISKMAWRFGDLPGESVCSSPFSSNVCGANGWIHQLAGVPHLIQGGAERCAGGAVKTAPIGCATTFVCAYDLLNTRREIDSTVSQGDAPAPSA